MDHRDEVFRRIIADVGNASSLVQDQIKSRLLQVNGKIRPLRKPRGAELSEMHCERSRESDLKHKGRRLIQRPANLSSNESYLLPSGKTKVMLGLLDKQVAVVE